VIDHKIAEQEREHYDGSTDKEVFDNFRN
ncbi:uncharacterized protein METZ01_LOCUS288795, partial [marine metagenome]